jgi:hypothetical protein
VTGAHAAHNGGGGAMVAALDAGDADAATETDGPGGALEIGLGAPSTTSGEASRVALASRAHETTSAALHVRPAIVFMLHVSRGSDVARMDAGWSGAFTGPEIGSRKEFLSPTSRPNPRAFSLDASACR